MAVGGAAIRAGRAFVELFADDTKLTRALTAAANRVKQFAGNVTSLGAKSATAGGAILAPLGKSFSDAVTKGAEIKRLSVISGETTGTISELAGAFSIAGSNIEEFGGVLEGLRGQIKSAADGNTELVSGLRGLNGRFLITKGLDTQLDMIAERFKSITLASDQAAVANQLFGASGSKLLPFLREGKEGIAKLKTEGARAGEIMSADDIERSYQVSKSFNLILTELKNTVVAVGSALLPTKEGTKEATDQIREAFAAARKWIAENGAMIIGLAKLAAGAVAGGVALVGIGIALGKVAAGIGLVVSGVKLAAGAFAMLLTPIGAVSGAIVALGAYWLTSTEKGKKAAADLGKAFTSAKETFSEAWGGIVDAVKKGDLETAFKIAGLGIKTIWNTMLVGLGKAFAGFLEDNREKLVALGALLGAVKGGRLGASLGPWGALAGAVGGGVGGGFGTDALIDTLKGVGNNPKLEASIAASQAELRALIAKGRGGPMGEGGKETDGAALDKARFDSYAKKLTEAAKELPFVGSSTKGAFAGPIGQQLGYADQTAKRQLDATKDVAKGVNQVVRGVDRVANEVEDLQKAFTWK